jgi:hypothetical protein
MSGPWYETIIPFVHAEIEPLYRFVQAFQEQLKPGITRLSSLYLHSQDAAEKQTLARLHGEICGLFSQTLFAYVQDPSPERLETTMERMLQIYQAGMDDPISS